MIERRLIEVEGLVQGIGFRPFVHHLATRLALKGSVRNHTSGVSIDVEGESTSLDEFLSELTVAPPPLAVIERVRLERAPRATYVAFSIEPSRTNPIRRIGARVAPDIATCDDCIRELFDPCDRRHRYAFLSCSRCGPRLTISLGAPYDRDRTTMRAFALCDACRREYENPDDRRFHAQTIACAECGPTLSLRSSHEPRLTGGGALAAAVAHLSAGDIVAVKGLGGFHLACDATNPSAVQRLRDRKRREAKPFAIMVRDIAEARRLCAVNDEEARLLESPQRPIVLARKRSSLPETFSEGIAPGNACLGVMLPYTPLHHLLLADTGRPLVMTSGNMSDEPIAYRDADALQRLSSVADAFLLNDREISTRCDDSVTRMSGGAPAIVRRSRGYAPSPIPLVAGAPVPTLGVGGHLKNTFCLTKSHSAYVSHHIGDLENADAFRALVDGFAHYTELFDARPEIIAHDLHPDYLSTQAAERLSCDEHIERVAVQHHHAHVLSCVAEQGVTEPVIGVAFDGAGLGLDGAIWGGEILFVDGTRFERMAHLSYVPLPGGDAAARHPWRSAVAHVWAANDGSVSSAPWSFIAKLDRQQLDLVTQMLPRASLAPATSSMGRLFDAVAALLGVRLTSRFEAQAAMELELIAAPTSQRTYAIDVVEGVHGCVIDSGSFIRGVLHDLGRRRSISEIAAVFHNAVCDATADAVMRTARRTGVRRVVLTGGAFQNVRLTTGLTTRLTGAGLDVLTHRRVPCNDGGLSLGQAYAAVLHASNASAPCA
jgi:hydrogenase maturation protein HypF